MRKISRIDILAFLCVGIIGVLLNCSFGGGTSTGDAQLRGHVALRDGKTSAINATVTFVHSGAHPDSGIERIIQTDLNGDYSIPMDTQIPEGEYNIFVMLNGQTSAETQVYIPLKTPENDPEEVRGIVLGNPASIKGSIVIDPSLKSEDVYILLMGTPYSKIVPDINWILSRDSLAAGDYDFNIVMKNSRVITMPASFSINEGDTVKPQIDLDINQVSVDSCEGTEINNFKAYWYVFDDSPKSPYILGNYTIVNQDSIIWLDSLKGGNSLITNINKTNNDYDKFVMTAGGNTEGSSGKAAYIKFDMGDSLPYSTPDSTFDTYIGIGTQLVPDPDKREEKVIDFDKAKKITYWAKASVPMNVTFQVLTDQGHFDLYGSYYQIIHPVDTTWKQYTVYLREKDPANPNDAWYLEQPVWAFDESWKYLLHPLNPGVNLGILPLDISKAMEIQWMISCFDNKHLKEQTGELWVDDIDMYYLEMDIEVTVKIK